METTKELSVVKEKLSFDEIMQLSKVFAESGMFEDAKSQAQAFVKIMAGAEIGLPAFASISGVHIIKGKTTIGAGLMAATVDSSPNYSYEVVKMDDTICILDFFKNGKKKGTSQFTIQDAKKAGTANTEKFPRNMLFARAMSNGTKWYAPGVFSGPVYTPDELQTIDITHEEVMPEVHIVEATPQPTIDNYVHVSNSIKKCTTMAELVTSWKRTTLETQSHPAVEDELNAKIKEIFEASTTEKELADSFKAGKDGGLYSKTSKNIAFVSGIKDEVKLKLTSKA